MAASRDTTFCPLDGVGLSNFNALADSAMSANSLSHSSWTRAYFFWPLLIALSMGAIGMVMIGATTSSSCTAMLELADMTPAANAELLYCEWLVSMAHEASLRSCCVSTPMSCLVVLP